jgi:hypothetical protein
MVFKYSEGSLPKTFLGGGEARRFLRIKERKEQ